MYTNYILLLGMAFVRQLLVSHLGGSRGGGVTTPFQISKIKESNKTEKKKIEYNPFEKKEERKSCMFV